MTKDLLWRGMLAGILAAILATLFARGFAEPQVDLALAFEASHAADDANAHAMHEMPASTDTPATASTAAADDELVSRGTQAGLGLLTALGLYGAAVGGIFALVFAYAYGRMARIGPRTFALLLASLAFVAIVLVPAFKYPPTPPAVGQHETVAMRTMAYFAMIGISIAALMIALRVRALASERFGAFNGFLAAAATFILLVAAIQLMLPVIDEVPADFPATVLWRFRLASLATQAVLWMALGIGFGVLADRRIRHRA